MNGEASEEEDEAVKASTSSRFVDEPAFPTSSTGRQASDGAYQRSDSLGSEDERGSIGSDESSALGSFQGHLDFRGWKRFIRKSTAKVKVFRESLDSEGWKALLKTGSTKSEADIGRPAALNPTRADPYQERRDSFLASSSVADCINSRLNDEYIARSLQGQFAREGRERQNEVRARARRQRQHREASERANGAREASDASAARALHQQYEKEDRDRAQTAHRTERERRRLTQDVLARIIRRGRQRNCEESRW
ncbi:hypothetical protein LTR37_015766 [Vermiconidia calcicola]|uniref:Uncharacterized protein n=1 Tax=Vermiconidia calcicola TaxID=1690605 RepID=A0ACC3MPT4_9PEZI|nr:hypothetical protein LTR37_015766 [Vermiconidia calcicola]